MPFNTAIFYDIENLLKGYNFSQQMAANLSLEEILVAIKQTERLSQIAVQRAYANWGDPRLSIMRGEINELSIEPIQVFGFSRDQKKNAADIQLAIDAIDLAHVRPALEVFVIVSGDGGFASLAKKLHEYGKTVIGCAYRSAANKIFQAVCDDFVWITDPDEEERQERDGSPVSMAGSQVVSDPRNVRLAAKISQSKSANPEEVLAKVKEVLNWYASDSTCRMDLARVGIYLSVVQEAVKYTVPNFQPIRFGFAKFIEYLQYACKGSQLCIARPSNSQAVLILRNAVRSGVEVLPDLDVRDLHTVDGYRSILASGSPIIRIPPAGELHAIVDWITQHATERLDLGSIIDEVATGLNGAVSSEVAKQGVLSLVAVNAFEREPEGSSLSEQKLTLQPDVRAAKALLALLWNAARTKITDALGQVRDDVLGQLLGTTSDPATTSAGDRNSSAS